MFGQAGLKELSAFVKVLSWLIIKCCQFLPKRDCDAVNLLKSAEFIVCRFMINQKLFAQFVTRYLNKHSCKQTEEVSKGEICEEEQERVELTCPYSALHIVNSEKHENAVT